MRGAWISEYPQTLQHQPSIPQSFSFFCKVHIISRSLPERKKIGRPINKVTPPVKTRALFNSSFSDVLQEMWHSCPKVFAIVVHVHIHINIHIHIHINIHVNIHIKWAYIYIIYTNTYAYTNIHLYIHNHPYIYVIICVIYVSSVQNPSVIPFHWLVCGKRTS